MSVSSRHHGEIENSVVELPVIVLPTELVFSLSKRRSLLTIFNPYGNEAQFRIMTTSPDRFDVSVTKGTIKPNRKIDITIRLLCQKLDELPELTDELQIIDYFRVTLKIGLLKGNQSIEVHWCNQVQEISEVNDSTSNMLGCDDASTKFKVKPHKSTSSGSVLQLATESTSTAVNRSFTIQKSSTRPGRQTVRLDHQNNGSSVNLVCTVCAVACVLMLFMPLASDSELCKKATQPLDQTTKQTVGFLSQLASILSVSYEMKLGCSFALGLFTYRLISTLPD